MSETTGADPSHGRRRLLISADDLSLMPELVGEGGYDIPFTAFLQRTLNPDAVFVDVGTNVGLFTVIGARSAWQGQVIAYEPVPSCLSCSTQTCNSTG